MKESKNRKKRTKKKKKTKFNGTCAFMHINKMQEDSMIFLKSTFHLNLDTGFQWIIFNIEYIPSNIQAKYLKPLKPAAKSDILKRKIKIQ